MRPQPTRQSTRLSIRLSDWLDRIQPNEATVMGGAALAVGLTTGLGVWLFKQLIEVVRELAFVDLATALKPLGDWTIVLLPMAGGLIVGLLMHFFVGEERHHGVAGIMEAVALAGGRLRYRRVPLKALASAISIGAGASIGPEDPSVQIGSNLGSMLGQLFRLSDDRVRTLVAGGAAGAIAAAFNAPIAGIFFALEIIIGELTGSTFGSVALAAVISAVTTQVLTGPEPAFHVPRYAFTDPVELPLYLGLGLLAGVVAVLYIRAIYGAQDIFHGLRAPRWIKPIIAGALVGVAGLFLPQIFGVGYSTIESLLNGVIPSLALLVALLVVKLLMTAISVGGGFPGGVFAPSLFLGAVLGSAFGTVMQAAFPQLPVAPPAYALAGMAAVLAGTVHAPLTAIILLFEMTNDYRIILPVMFAVVVSLVLSQRLLKDSVYTLGLARKGIRLQRGRDVEVLETITVGEVMQTRPQVLHDSDSLTTAIEVLARTRHHGLPVLNAADQLVGILTVTDLDQLPPAAPRTVGEVCTRELLTAFPDETIGAALRRMGARDVGRLPVVARDNPQQLLGLLRRTDLVRAYDIALTRRAQLRHAAQQVRLGAFTGAQVIEIVIGAGAPCANRRVKDVSWPADCVLASLRRGRQMVIPHGDTLLHGGDVLVAVTEASAANDLLKLCQSPERT
jgi:CIC family chloride channel protein